MSALDDHLASGATTLCRAWAITRGDGVVLGFTDHDRALGFDGITFKPGSGLTASALEQSSGLASDNTEAAGILSDAGLSEADLRAGRFDRAEVRIWQVNWADPAVRAMIFRGHLGEVRWQGQAFEAELRGLGAGLAAAQGRVFSRLCDAGLGDGRCGVDLTRPAFRAEAEVIAVRGARVVTLPALPDHADRWFEAGQMVVLDGAAQGLSGGIKTDRASGDRREIALWDGLRAGLAPGDRVAVIAGCDKRAETCRLKFANILNFQGFPFLPGDDWVLRAPGRSGPADGGSLFS